MAEGCACSIAGLLDPGINGIISATINAGTDIKVTTDGVILQGPTLGSVNISAYPFPSTEKNLMEYFQVECPSKVGASMSWVQKYDCDNDIYYFIPMRGGLAWYEGDLPVQFEKDEDITDYESLNASAASGPGSVVLQMTHFDIYGLSYSGLPIAITAGEPESYNILTDILPVEAELYLQSFSFEFTPPASATVNYSFAFVYNLP
jgi:hypothetical protein